MRGKMRANSGSSYRCGGHPGHLASMLAFLLATVLVLVALLAVLPASAIAEEETDEADETYVEMSISELSECDESYDGMLVMVTAEVVGESIDADDEHSWIALSQDGSAMSVYMDDYYASQIQHYGSYEEIGDTVTVYGTFHIDCSAHAGDMDIHVTSMTFVEEGSAAVAEIDSLKLYFAVGIVALGLIMAFVYWRLSERQR